MTLVKFKRNEDGNTFRVAFDDGFETDVTAETLRLNCPCAGCKGEEVLLHKYEPVNPMPMSKDSFILEKAEISGNYAIQLFWKDGHNTGLYNWQYLKDIIKNQ